METPIPQQGATGTPQEQPSAAQGIANTAQDISQQPAENAQLPSNITPEQYSNTPPLLRRPLDQFTALPDEAWDYGMPNGVRAGVQYTDPQYNPGTLEYRMRSGDQQWRAANQYMYDSVKNNFDSISQLQNRISQRDVVPGSLDPNLPATQAYYAQIMAKLPQSDRNAEGVSNYILNVGQKEAEHNAQYMYKFVGPVLKAKIDAAKSYDEFPDIASMLPKEFAQIALDRGANPAIVKEFLASENDPAKKFAKTSLYNKFMPLIDSLDPVTRIGKLALLDPEKYFFNLPDGSMAKHQVFKAMARYKAKHSTQFVSGVIDSVRHLGYLAAYGTAGIATGAGSAVVSGVTLGNVNIKSGSTVLSDAFINGDPGERKQAEQALERSSQYLKTIGPKLRDVLGKGDDADASAYIQTTFGQYADPEMLDAFKQLSYYKKKGAYRPGYEAEKLAAFGEGVMDAAPAIFRFFNNSIDMNSVMFRRQIRSEEEASTGVSIVGSALLKGAADSWITGTDLYKNMESREIDKSINTWTSNYFKQTAQIESKSAMLWESVGFTEAAKIARGQMQDTTMVQAGQMLDPVTLTIGGAALFGVKLPSAAATKAVQAIAKDYEAVATEVAAGIRKSTEAGGKLNPTLQTAVDTVREQLKKQYPGATITDEQAIAAALGQRGAGSVGRSAAGKIIRNQVGAEIAGNEALITRVKSLEKAVDEATGAATKETGAVGRPVGGRALQAVGEVTERSGSAVRKIGATFEDISNVDTAVGISARKRFWFGVLRSAGKGANITGYTASIGGAGYLLYQGDIVGAMLSGVGGSLGTLTINQLVKPQFLIELGTNVQQIGRLSKAIGAAGRVGQKQGSSLFLQTANNLEAEARAMGNVSTDAAKMSDKARLAGDAAKLRELWRLGYENVTLNTARVLWEDGVIGGGTGAFIAHLADRDATGSGAGFGTTLSATLRAASRMWQMTPTGAQAGAEVAVAQDLNTAVRDMSQTNKARLFEYLGDIKADPVGYRQRANIARDLIVSNRGNVEFVNEGEFASSFILAQSHEAEAAMIMKESSAAYPGDPAKQAAYAARRKQQLDSQRQAQNNLTATQSSIAEQQAKINSRQKAMQDGAAVTAKLEADVATARQTDTTGKVLDSANKALNNHLAVMSKHEMEVGILTSEMEQLQGQAAAARSEVGTATPFRIHEERTMPDGSVYQKFANGAYIETTPGKAGRVVIDINNIDNIGAISEGWHSLLNSEAAKRLMPEMIDMVWGDPTSGRRIMSDALREHFFDAYLSTLPAEQAAKYKTQLALAVDNWAKGGKKDSSALIPYTQELMTWYMSTIDSARRPNYRPGISTPPGLGAPVGTYESGIRKLLLGERGIRDARVLQDYNLMLHPDMGIIAKASAEHIKLSLEKAGMRFIEASDGTLRGYFFNNKNEIIRNPVLNDFYERVLDITGGKGGERIKPVNLYDSRIPVADRVDYVRSRGMDWVLNEGGTDILPPEQVAKKSTEFSNEARNSLAGVEGTKTGLTSITNPDRPGEITFTGIPTQADIDAIASNQKIHPTVRGNLVLIMESMANGQSKEVLVGTYHNVFSVNETALTEARLMVGKDIKGYSSTKHFVPLSVEFGFADVKDANGKTITVVNEEGKRVPLRQAVTRVNTFNPRNLEVQKNRGFTEGLVVRDKEGTKLGYYKSPDGRDYTPEMLRELWVDDAAFMDDANKWINHIYAAGFQDPYTVTPTSIPKEPSASVLSPSNFAEGEAKRDALRIIFGTDTAADKRSWVYANRPGANTTKFAVRGTDFPIETLRVDALSPATTQGDSFNIDLRAVVGGGFALSPNRWKTVQLPLFDGGRFGAKASSLTLQGIQQDAPARSAMINVESVKTHPFMDDVKLYKGRDEAGIQVWAYTTGEGKVEVLNPGLYKTEKEALKLLIGKIREKESQSWVDTALQGFKNAEERGQGIANPAKQTAKTGVAPGAAKENPMYSQRDYDQIQLERDQLAAADAYENDPAVAQESRARMRGDRIKASQQIVLDHIAEVKLRDELIARGWTEEQAANQVAQMKSDNGWAAQAEIEGRKLDKQKAEADKAWLSQQNAAVRDHWANENAEIAKIEKQRLEAHREAQALKAKEGREAEARRIQLEKAALKFDAQLLARKRALAEMVDVVQKKQKVNQSQIDSLNAEWLASDEPLIAPGLLKVDPANLPVAASQTVVGTMPIKGRPYINVVSAPIYLERVPGFKNTQAGQATNQARFNNMVVPGSNMGAVNKFYRGPMDAAELTATIGEKRWVSEGQTMLIAHLKEARAASGGNLTVYKVYGVNGNSVYVGNNATAALKAVQKNDEEETNKARVRTPQKLSANVKLATEALRTVPKPTDTSNANRMEYKYKGLGDKYNQPTQR